MPEEQVPEWMRPLDDCVLMFLSHSQKPFHHACEGEVVTITLNLCERHLLKDFGGWLAAVKAAPSLGVPLGEEPATDPTSEKPVGV